MLKASADCKKLSQSWRHKCKSRKEQDCEIASKYGLGLSNKYN